MAAYMRVGNLADGFQALEECPKVEDAELSIYNLFNSYLPWTFSSKDLQVFSPC